MTDRDTPGAQWFREDKARREKEAADALRAAQRKRLDELNRARAEQAIARQDSFAAPQDAAAEERALMERILAESDPRARERLEAALRVLRERRQRDAGRAAQGAVRRTR
ncbi:MAG: hypothetical protein NTW15_13940 [Burkholderiales bacterium]|nr:hypothetical protein [Burkholderiales bacterium]